MESRRFRILLLRGLLGGAVGGFILAASAIAVQIDSFGTTWDQWLFIFYLIFGLPFGLSSGAITAITIWLIHHHTRANLGPIVRVIVGSISGMITGATGFWLMTNKANSLSTSWRSLGGFVVFGIVIGGVPGLLVGRQDRGDLRSRP